MVTPTPELRSKLRRHLDERIILPGTDQDTRFLDAEIDELLLGAQHLYSAVATGWKMKAAWAMSERGGLEESQAGDERHKFIKLTEYRDHCLAMGRMYAAMVPGFGSVALGYDLPAVPGVET